MVVSGEVTSPAGEPCTATAACGRTMSQGRLSTRAPVHAHASSRSESCAEGSVQTGRANSRDSVTSIKASKASTAIPYPAHSSLVRDDHGNMRAADIAVGTGSQKHHVPGVHEAATQPGPQENNFSWGEVDGATITRDLRRAYEEVVHWRRNIFMVPSGAVGKEFVRELTRLLQGFAQDSAIAPIAFHAIMTAPSLLLQRTEPKIKAKDCQACLQRRLMLWRAGNITSLLEEGRAIQSQLSSVHGGNHQTLTSMGQTLAKQVYQGNIRAALRTLDDGERKGGVLALDEKIGEKSVLTLLKEKHPTAKAAKPEALLLHNDFDGPVHCRPWHPVIFDRLTGDAVRSVFMKSEGSAGPSALDALAWRRLSVSFGEASDDLCQALADVAKRMCTQDIAPSHLSAYLACRLVPLDKKPGVRPIGICEVIRRVIGKAVLKVLGQVIQRCAGTVQLCAGQPAGIEAAIHAMREIFEDEEVEAMLLVDASNAFNQLNRKAALQNIEVLCPQFATMVRNTYKEEARLFVGGKEVRSAEGTTQGDPLAMSIYALATLPLIWKLQVTSTKQIWYADDATDAGKLAAIKHWWDRLVTCGPDYGYFANPPKTWLLVKEAHEKEARAMFAETGINITTEGRRLLGAAVGNKQFVNNYVDEAAQGITERVLRLAEVARSQPQAAYSVFTHGLSNEWTFLSRTMDNSAEHLRQVEDAISGHFIPSLTGQNVPGGVQRELFALPARMGGLGLVNPSKAAEEEYATSCKVTAPLSQRIVSQTKQLGQSSEDVSKLKKELSREKAKRQAQLAEEIRKKLPTDTLRTVEAASEKGASSWLTVLPLERHGFCLHKGAFRDALCLRYNWHPQHLPSVCVCGQPFTTTHALSCPTGGYPTLRHNQLRNLTARLLREVCHDVSVEPVLQPLSGEELLGRTCNREDQARLDIAARGVWGNRSQRAFFDVRVFNPCAQSMRSIRLPAAYERQEKEKRRAYQQRVCQVEHGSFTPLVFSTAGGMGKAATIFYRRLADMMAERQGESYSKVMAWLRAVIGFALISSAVTCLRGDRGRRYQFPLTPSLAAVESQLV